MATVKGDYFTSFNVPTPRGMPYTTLAILKETFTPGSTNDIRKLVKIPFGLTFTPGTFMQVGDMDTGTALVLTMRATKDGISFKTLIHQSTAGQAGGLAVPTKGPAIEDGIGFTTDSKDWWVELLYSTQATGAQSADFVYGIGLSGFYRTGTIAE